MKNTLRLLLALLLIDLAACGAQPDPLPAAAPPSEPPSASPAPASLAPPSAALPAPVPPVAEKRPVTRTLHGDSFVDDYFWLREKGTAPVEAYLRAEASYAQAVMAPYAALEETLFKEIVSHIAEDDESVPYKDGEFLYWHRVVKGKEHPIFLRRPVAGGAEAVILDVNALAAGKAFMQLGELEVSDDGRYLLYSTDETGFRQYTMHIKDLNTGALLPDTAERVVMAGFASDGQTVLYVVEDDSKRPYRLYRHRLGAPGKRDAVIYEEKDARFELYAWRLAAKQYFVAHSESKLQTEVRLIDARNPAKKPVLVERRGGEHRYFVEHRGDSLVIRTNDQGRDFRVATTPLAKPGQKNWKTLREARDGALVESMHLMKDHLATLVYEDALPHLDVYDFKTQKTQRIAMPEAVYDAGIDDEGNAELDTTKLRYTYQSMTTPDTVFEYDAATGQSTRLKEDPVPGGFSRENYVTERTVAKAKDGTSIPISLVYRKGFERNGKAPLFLHGYGAYGISYFVEFSQAQLTLLDRGVVVGIAHVRGGAELGKGWHEAGRLANKMNTFTDFIACAEHLVSEGYAARDRVAIEGGSAGGLLMGAVTNLRPDLFRVVVNDVPFVDVINTMNDPTLPLTITEYEEWGNPAIKAQYDWMRPYSPYDNLAARPYPAILVKTSYHDSQVMYWEPAKYVARLRALKTDQNPLIFKINLDAGGHGGMSGRYERYHEAAYEQAFVLSQLGIGAAAPAR